jgi:hypothetical protein
MPLSAHERDGYMHPPCLLAEVYENIVARLKPAVLMRVEISG